MTQEELNMILDKHRKWLNNEEGGERADLCGADLSGANLDYSCWPLWCENKILDATCGSRTMWFNKHHPAVVYCDKRVENITGTWGESERTCTVSPDIQCDFTCLPFGDNSFALVVFDPPHLIKAKETSWLVKKYGKLDENWKQMLHDGFAECMRVLKPDGVLVFKWSEHDIPADNVWKAIGQRPLFGHRSGKKSGTFWGVFMKGIK